MSHGECADGTDGGTDGRQTDTLCLLLDAASCTVARVLLDINAHCLDGKRRTVRAIFHDVASSVELFSHSS